VIIISHNGFNLTPNWNSIVIVPVSTSQNQAMRSPTTVNLPSGSGGLEKDSVALCHQITTLDKSKLQKKLGSLSDIEIKEIEQSIKFALAMS
jgi:mRNA interferase MazF